MNFLAKEVQDKKIHPTFVVKFENHYEKALD